MAFLPYHKAAQLGSRHRQAAMPSRNSVMKQPISLIFVNTFCRVAWTLRCNH